MVVGFVAGLGSVLSTAHLNRPDVRERIAKKETTITQETRTLVADLLRGNGLVDSRE